MSKPILILDAFGVLYRPSDDVAEVLIPFVRQHGGTTDADYIKREYHNISLGRMTGTEFWQRMGLEPRLEDEYLEGIQLSAGVHEFLQATASHFDSLWCLSNDVSEWSRKLRVRHEIAAYFTGFVISGDAGIRKPDPGIYNLLLSRIGRTAMDCTFVDDRVKNLDSAKARGFRTVLFGSDEESVLHPSVASFTELTRWFLNTGP